MAAGGLTGPRAPTTAAASRAGRVVPFQAARALRRSGGSAGPPRALRRPPRRGSGGRQAFRTAAGLFDFLGPSAPALDGRGEELVDQLIETSRATNGGSRASQQTRDLIEQLVRTSRQVLARTLQRSRLSGGQLAVLCRLTTSSNIASEPPPGATFSPAPGRQAPAVNA